MFFFSIFPRIFNSPQKPETMKRLVTLIAFLTLGATCTFAQVRINGYASYVFDDSFDNRYSSTSYFNGRIEGGLQWGVGLEFTPREDLGIELSYFRQDTEAPVSYWRGGPIEDVLEVGINYVLLGANYYLPTGTVFEPYASLQAGMIIYDNKQPTEGEPNSVVKFAWGGRLGTNIWISDAVGLKAQASLHSAVQSVGGGFYFGTGGAGAGVSTFSTLFQFGLGGGLVVRFGGR